VVHGIREGKIVWSRPEQVVMNTLGREKLMQHMLLGFHEFIHGKNDIALLLATMFYLRLQTLKLRP